MFEEAWPSWRAAISAGCRSPRVARLHTRRRIFQSQRQVIDLGAHVRAGDLVDKLSALTANRLEEAAYFCVGGHRYKLQVRITKE